MFIRGMTTSWKPFITICYRPFIRTLFSWRYFTPSQFTMGVFCWWFFMLLHVCIKIHMWRILIYVCYITCWERPTNVTPVKVLAIISVSYLQGYILIESCLICDRLAVIYECFTYVNNLYVFVRSETGNCCIGLFY